MSATRKPGVSDMRGAVAHALGLGITKAEAAARPYWWMESGDSGYVASDFLVELFLMYIAGNIKTSLKKGGMVSIRGFGTFFVGRHWAHTGRGALAGRQILAGKEVRFRPGSAGWAWPGFPG